MLFWLDFGLFKLLSVCERRFVLKYNVLRRLFKNRLTNWRICYRVVHWPKLRVINLCAHLLITPFVRPFFIMPCCQWGRPLHFSRGWRLFTSFNMGWFRTPLFKVSLWNGRRLHGAHSDAVLFLKISGFWRTKWYNFNLFLCACRGHGRNLSIHRRCHFDDGWILCGTLNYRLTSGELRVGKVRFWNWIRPIIFILTLLFGGTKGLVILNISIKFSVRKIKLFCPHQRVPFLLKFDAVISKLDRGGIISHTRINSTRRPLHSNI